MTLTTGRHTNVATITGTMTDSAGERVPVQCTGCLVESDVVLLDEEGARQAAEGTDHDLHVDVHPEDQGFPGQRIRVRQVASGAAEDHGFGGTGASFVALQLEHDAEAAPDAASTPMALLLSARRCSIWDFIFGRCRS